MKIFKKGDKNGKGGVDLKSMPLLGNTFKDKVSLSELKLLFILLFQLI
jgi:hypothetical protein